MQNPSDPSASVDAAERRAREFLAQMDPRVGVGSKHHTVPRFLLDRFAQDGRLLVRDRSTGAARGVRATDLAIRDFYTVRDFRGSGGLDGTIEQLLSKVESAAAHIVRRLCEPSPAPLTPQETVDLMVFISLQMVRGPRHRAEIELMAEWYAKARLSAPTSTGLKHEHAAEVRRARQGGRTPSRGNGGWKQHRRRRRLPPDDALRSLRVRPDPQAHVATLGVSAELGKHLLVRPITVVELDRPLLVIGDEPVVIFGGSQTQHKPQCFMTPDDRRRADRQAVKRGRPRRELVHMRPTRPSGIQGADAVALPVAPDRILLLGDERGRAPMHMTLTGVEADEAADDMNARIVNHSFLWIAGRPDHPTLRTLEVPTRGPLFTVCGRDTAAVEALASAHTSPLRRIRDLR